MYSELVFSNTVIEIYADVMSGKTINMLIAGKVTYSASFDSSKLADTFTVSSESTSCGKNHTNAKIAATYLSSSSEKEWSLITITSNNDKEISIGGSTVPIYLGTKADIDIL